MAENRQYNVNLNNEAEVYTMYDIPRKAALDGSGGNIYTRNKFCASKNNVPMKVVISTRSVSGKVAGYPTVNNIGPDVDLTSPTFVENIDGTETSMSLMTSDIVTGNNPAINLSKKATFMRGTYDVPSTLPGYVEISFNDTVLAKRTCELLTSVDITNAEVYYYGNGKAMKINGTAMNKTGGNYGTYSYTNSSNDVVSGDITGYTLLNNVVKECATNNYELTLTFNSGDVLTGADARGIGCMERYTVTSNEDEVLVTLGPGLNIQTLGTEYDGNIGVTEKDTWTIDSDKTVYVLGLQVEDAVTVTKDGSTLNSEVVQKINIKFE